MSSGSGHHARHSKFMELPPHPSRHRLAMTWLRRPLPSVINSRPMSYRIAKLGLLLALLPLPVAAATMPPVRMKMIDAQDGSPVQGAHVLFQANGREGTFTGHGGRSANLFVAEALTDVSGEFS